MNTEWVKDMNIVDEVLSTIPKHYLNSELKYSGNVMTLSEFITNVLVPSNPNAPAKAIADKVKSRYIPMLRPDDKYMFISAYIEARKNDGTFVAKVNDNFDVEEYLLTTVYENMDENHDITLGGKTRNIDDLYSTITTNSNIFFDKKDVEETVDYYIRAYLDNGDLDPEVLTSMVDAKYNLGCTIKQYCIDNAVNPYEVTYDGETRYITDFIKIAHDKQLSAIDSKIQECQRLLSGVREDVLESKLNGFVDKTTREYIIEVIPTMMTNKNTVVFNKTEHNLKEYITSIIDKQTAYLDELEAKNNRVNENPDLLNDIVISPDRQATSEIIIPLNEDEVNVLTNNEKAFTPEEQFRTDLTKLKSAIYRSRTEHDLEGKINQLRDIESRSSMIGLSDYISQMISSCWDLANAKKQELVKISANTQELAEIMDDELKAIHDKVRRTDSVEELNSLELRLNKYDEMITSKKVTDISVRDSVKDIHKLISARRTVLGLTQEDNIVNNKMVKYDIEAELIRMKNTNRSMEYETDLRVSTAYEISLQNDVAVINQKIETAHTNGAINDNEYNEFIEILNSLEKNKEKGMAA